MVCKIGLPVIILLCFILKETEAHLAEAVEYTNCILAEG